MAGHAEGSSSGASTLKRPLAEGSSASDVSAARTDNDMNVDIDTDNDTGAPHKRARLHQASPPSGSFSSLAVASPAPAVQAESAMAVELEQESEDEEPVVVRKDKGKGKMKYLPELPPEMWCRIWAVYYYDVAQEYKRSGVYKGALLPLLISPDLITTALPILYACPLVSSDTYHAFRRAIHTPSSFVPFDIASLVHNIHIQASGDRSGAAAPIPPPISNNPNGRNPGSSSRNTRIHSSFPSLLGRLRNLSAFTLKDTAVLNGWDAAYLFDALRRIHPRRVRLEIRMWDLSSSFIDNAFRYSSSTGTYNPFAQALDTFAGVSDTDNSLRPMLLQWGSALAGGRNMDLPRMWLDPPPETPVLERLRSFPAPPHVPPPPPPQSASSSAPGGSTASSNTPAVPVSSNAIPLPWLTPATGSAAQAGPGSSSSSDSSAPGSPTMTALPDADALSTMHRDGPIMHRDPFLRMENDALRSARLQRLERGQLLAAELATGSAVAGPSTSTTATTANLAGPSTSAAAATLAVPSHANAPAIEQASADEDGDSHHETSVSDRQAATNVDEGIVDIAHLEEELEGARSRYQDAREQHDAARQVAAALASTTDARKEEIEDVRRRLYHLREHCGHAAADAMLAPVIRAHQAAVAEEKRHGASLPELETAMSTALTALDVAMHEHQKATEVLLRIDLETRTAANIARRKAEQDGLVDEVVFLGSNEFPRDRLQIQRDRVLKLHFLEDARRRVLLRRSRESQSQAGAATQVQASSQSQTQAGLSDSAPAPDVTTSSSDYSAVLPTALPATAGYPPLMQQTSYRLAQTMRWELLSIIRAWDLDALSIVALDPLASLLVRAPYLDFWTMIPVPHIRIHLPRGVGSLVVLQGVEDCMREKKRAQARAASEEPGQAVAAAAATGPASTGVTGPGTAAITGVGTGGGAGAVPGTSVNMGFMRDEADGRIVGGDGNGGGLVHESVRLFEIEVNTLKEMSDDVWEQAGPELPAVLCRILAGQHDWDESRGGFPMGSESVESDFAPASPSPSGESETFDSDADAGSGEDDADEEMSGEGEMFDASAAAEQERRVMLRKAARAMEGE